MAYKLEKPFTDIERADFIVEYNHKKGLKIEETANALYALLENECMKNGVPVINENYEAELAEKRKESFEQEFFETSLGWIRRKVSMKDGAKKDFLSDLLLQIKAGIEMGQQVPILTYLKPDFTQEISEEYMQSLQVQKTATSEFIQECLNQTVTDFCGG